MKKRLALFTVAAVFILTLPLGACSEKYGETYTGAVSEAAYDSAEDAAKGFLAEEISGYEFTAEFSDYTAQKTLSQKEISALGIGEDYLDGLVSVEEGTVIFKKKASEYWREWFALFNYSYEARVSEEDIEEFYRDLNLPQDNQTRTVYLLNYGTSYRFCAPLPANGETLCASYYKSLFIDDNYLNCTVEAECRSRDLNEGWEDVYHTSFIKSTEAGFYQTIGQHDVISGSYEFVYVNRYGFFVPDERWWYGKALYIVWDDGYDVSRREDQHSLIQYVFDDAGDQLTRGFLPLDHSCYIKTKTGAELESRTAIAGRFLYGFPKEEFKFEQTYLVSEGRIAQYKAVERWYDEEWTISICFSKFGSTKLEIPDEVKTALEDGLY